MLLSASSKKFRWLMRSAYALVLCLCCATLAQAESIAYWDFAQDLQNWKTNAMIADIRHTSDGLSFHTISPDPYLVL